jgi:O-acetylserine/cysteine efflux transporter
MSRNLLSSVLRASKPSGRMPVAHLLVALLAVSIWGFNFVPIKTALGVFPPFLLCALRFLLVLLPAVFVIPRPDVPWGRLAVYGLTMFGLQFGFLFTGMRLGMSAGLTPLVMQSQIFVTMAVGAFAFGERLTRAAIGGTLIAAAGLAVVAFHTGGEVTLAGLGFVLLAAASWAAGNLLSRRLGHVNAVALVVWGGLVVPVPMLAASLVFEGPAQIVRSLTQPGWWPFLSLLFIAYGATLVSFSLWNWLLARNPASTIAPLTLLVPVVGLLSSAALLGEPLPPWKLIAAGLVLTGLAVNLFGPGAGGRVAESEPAQPSNPTPGPAG